MACPRANATPTLLSKSPEWSSERQTFSVSSAFAFSKSSALAKNIHRGRTTSDFAVSKSPLATDA
eukprot:6179876-Pleurochrysis_carterae.AAC.12